MIIPESSNYWLKNAHIPACLLENGGENLSQTREGLSQVDLKIVQGKIQKITPSNDNLEDIPTIDLEKKIIFPCFVDVHTHLDKGHIWERSPNLTGTFENALTAVTNDSQIKRKPDDVYRRFEFALKCSYAHGTMAIRTHLDSSGEQGKINLQVAQELKKEWSDRLTLQAVCLVPLDYYQRPEGLVLADRLAEAGQILGGVAYMSPHLEEELQTVFKIAKERDMKLDLHVDENGDPNSRCLQKIAQATLDNDYINKVICGHCCSLAVQSQDVVKRTIELVKAAQIGIVSLPMCNLYLQDRQAGVTPFWRGITRVHELKAENISVCFASDNCRDPFYGFGDHDMLEVFRESVRIAHLDTPYADWSKSFTSNPAQLMGLPKSYGKIALNSSANLIIFRARYFSELFSRPQADRLVLREGKRIKAVVPEYSELDDLIFLN